MDAPQATSSPETVVPHKQTAAQFIPVAPVPDPTHEAYEFDKLKNTKRIVTQGQYQEIKMFRDLHRKRGNWLYMRKIENPDIAELNNDMLTRRTPVLGEP